MAQIPVPVPRSSAFCAGRRLADGLKLGNDGMFMP